MKKFFVSTAKNGQFQIDQSQIKGGGFMKKIKKMLVVLFTMVLAFTFCTPVIEAQAASKKLTISDKKATLYVNNLLQLSVKYGGKNVTKKAKWSSSDKKVVTVTKKGKIRSVGAGVAKVTAKYKGKKATCNVVVKSKIGNTFDDDKFAKDTGASRYGVLTENIIYAYDDAWYVELSTDYESTEKAYISVGKLDTTRKDRWNVNYYSCIFDYGDMVTAKSDTYSKTHGVSKNILEYLEVVVYSLKKQGFSETKAPKVPGLTFKPCKEDDPFTPRKDSPTP